MDKLTQLISDIIKLWQDYGLIYLNGMWKTFSLALICTVVGCLIGFAGQRVIQDTIRAALADELLFGKLANGGHVTVDLEKDGKIRLDFAEENSEAVV